ncbi:isoamyl acetate esterase [Scheffersomyces xylosifermentans]|uniref:isoamyl acetate esterase n=1 Tax=Scheffersomyces xylosifermentans TaxID=1304137 RepID=UPI00315CEB8B
MGLYYDKFILFGDSITQMSNGRDLDFSFLANLQDDYVRKLDIENRGYGGYNSKHAVEILPEILDTNIGESKIRLLTIFFGTNDAVDTIQYVPLDQYRQNLQKLVKMAQDKGIKVIVIGPGFHDAKLWNAFKESQGEIVEKDVTTNKQNKIYSDAARGVAEEFKVPFVDMWTAFRNYGNWTEEQVLEEYIPLNDLLTDGVHYTGKAYKLLYREVTGAIAQFYPELSGASLKQKLADWDDIDDEHLKQSIFKTEH